MMARLLLAFLQIADFQSCFFLNACEGANFEWRTILGAHFGGAFYLRRSFWGRIIDDTVLGARFGGAFWRRIILRGRLLSN
jgi:hypothetical protein